MESLENVLCAAVFFVVVMSLLYAFYPFAAGSLRMSGALEKQEAAYLAAQSAVFWIEGTNATLGNSTLAYYPALGNVSYYHLVSPVIGSLPQHPNATRMRIITVNGQLYLMGIGVGQ